MVDACDGYLAAEASGPSQAFACSTSYGCTARLVSIDVVLTLQPRWHAAVVENNNTNFFWEADVRVEAVCGMRMLYGMVW